MNSQVILVDENDNEIGVQEKMPAHEQGQLHRCFSVFVFNSQGELLIHQRAANKYHAGGLWANTCCSHPQPGQDLLAEARKRLREEMGFDCELKEVFTFIYKVQFDNGLWENEYDHVLTGMFDGQPKPDPAEVDDYKWISLVQLSKDIKTSPEKYVPWLKIVMEKHKKNLETK